MTDDYELLALLRELRDWLDAKDDPWPEEVEYVRRLDAAIAAITGAQQCAEIRS